jgi:hypothetical protein
MMQFRSAGDVAEVIFIFMLIPHVLGAALQVVFGRLASFGQMDPLERNLQRVSHGIAVIAAVGALKAGSYEPAIIAFYTRFFGYAASAGLWLQGLMILYCLASALRIRTGLRALRFFNAEFHEHAPIMRAGAAVKAVLGLGGLVYLHLNHDQYIYAGGWWVTTYDTLWLAAAWCAVIGPIRLFLLRARRIGGADDTVQTNIDDNTFHW